MTQGHVEEILEKARKPLTVREICERLEFPDSTNPQTVNRKLKKLRKVGIVNYITKSIEGQKQNRFWYSTK